MGKGLNKGGEPSVKLRLMICLFLNPPFFSGFLWRRTPASFQTIKLHGGWWGWKSKLPKQVPDRYATRSIMHKGRFLQGFVQANCSIPFVLTNRFIHLVGRPAAFIFKRRETLIHKGHNGFRRGLFRNVTLNGTGQGIDFSYDLACPSATILVRVILS